MFRIGEGDLGCFRIYHQCPTSELSNKPPPDHGGFTGPREICHSYLEGIASGFGVPVTFVTDLSSLIALLTNATVALLIQCQDSTPLCMRTSLAQELRNLGTFEPSLGDKGWKKDSTNISVLAKEQGH